MRFRKILWPSQNICTLSINTIAYKKNPNILAKQHTYIVTYISTYVTTIWYKNINLPFFKRSKYVKYVKNPIGFAHKNLTTVFFTPKQEIRAFRHYFFSLLLTEKWFLCDMERVALFFLSRFGDNSVTIDGDLKQKLVRFDKIFFLFFF